MESYQSKNGENDITFLVCCEKLRKMERNIVVLSTSSSSFPSSHLGILPVPFSPSFLLEMAAKKDGKRRYEKMEEEEVEEEDTGELGFGEDDGKKKVTLTTSISSKKGSSSGGGSTASCCQADNCNAHLKDTKPYYKRHKICEFHAKAAMAMVGGSPQRFCQQCSRFHELSEFDNSKRSCRSRLAGHNERRRKSLPEFHGDGFHQVPDVKGSQPWRQK